MGLIDSRFIVTESVDSSITVCAELQEGFLGRNISLMVVDINSNGEIIIMPPTVEMSVVAYGLRNYEIIVLSLSLPLSLSLSHSHSLTLSLSFLSALS